MMNEIAHHTLISELAEVLLYLLGFILSFVVGYMLYDWIRLWRFKRRFRR